MSFNNLFGTQYIYSTVRVTNETMYQANFFDVYDTIVRRVTRDVAKWEKKIVGEYGYAEVIRDLYMEKDRDSKNNTNIYVFRKLIKPIVITRPIIII